MKRQEYINNINNKQLVIRGTGKVAKHFFNDYGAIFDIKLSTSNVSGDYLEGTQRIESKEIYQDKNRYYVIVCLDATDDVFFELVSGGLRFGHNFMDYRLFLTIKQNRKIFLEVGQCELALTHYILNNLSNLETEYSFFYYDEYKVLGIEDKKPLLQAVLEVNEIIESADVLIYPVNLGSRDIYYKKLIEKTHNTCAIVAVPLSTFEAYWPQDNKKNYYEKSKYCIDKATDNIRNDANMEQALEEGDKSVIEKINNIDFYNADVVNRGFERTFKKFEIIERKSDIKISDYYRKNYSLFPIYMDRGHISVEVAKEYSRRILDYLKITYDYDELEHIDLSWYEQCHSEDPIYLCVEKAIGLPDKSIYRLVQGDTIIYLSREEYLNKKFEILKAGYMYRNSLESEGLE